MQQGWATSEGRHAHLEQLAGSVESAGDALTHCRDRPGPSPQLPHPHTPSHAAAASPAPPPGVRRGPSLAAVEKLRLTEGQGAIDAIDVAAGLSLGEYTALAFAGAIK